MTSILSKVYAILRNEGVTSLAASTRWYITARSVPWPLRTNPTYLRKYIRFRQKLQPDRFTDADPFKVIWIDPKEIDYQVRGRRIPLSFGRVSGGDWDLRKSPFDENLVVRSVQARIREGKSWNETELYAEIEQQESVGSESSLQGSVKRLERIDELAENMRREGYRSQIDLLKDSSADPWATTERIRGQLHPQLNEVGVNIDRDGKFLWRHRGRHRLAIARALELDSIAVQILTRHRGWQEIREMVRDTDPKSEFPEALQSHPDLRDLR